MHNYSYSYAWKLCMHSLNDKEIVIDKEIVRKEKLEYCHWVEKFEEVIDKEIVRKAVLNFIPKM